MSETNTETLSDTAPKMVRKREEMLLLRQAVERLERRQLTTPIKAIGHGAQTLYRTTTTFVFLLLLMISGFGWWMWKTNSLKSYVNLGCNPDPNLYSTRFTPAPLPLGNDITIEDLVMHQQQRIEQLLLINSELNMDRESVRAACTK